MQEEDVVTLSLVDPQAVNRALPYPYISRNDLSHIGCFWHIDSSTIFPTPVFPSMQYFFAYGTFYAYILFHIKIFHIKSTYW